jgi:hypothetical protein
VTSVVPSTMPEIQLYEAVVTDAAPDANLPGHIKVRIPELFDDLEVPITIPPMYPGWFAGGWHSVPSALNPDTDAEDVRVIVIRLGNMSFKWIGSSQSDAFITDNPGTRAGARSGDGRHRLFLDNTAGFFSQIASDTEDTFNFISVAPDDTIVIQTADGSTMSLSEKQVNLLTADGDVLSMNDGDITLMQQDGVASLSLRTGDIAALSGKNVQISGSTIELGGGTIPPIHPYVLSMTLLADLVAVLADVVAIGAAIPTMTPFVATNAISMIAKVSTSLSAGAPYLSTRISGD